MKPKILWLYLISISLVAVVMVNNINPTARDLSHNLGHFLGQIIGILFIPGIYYLFKKNDLNDSGALPNGFIKTIIIITLLIASANVFVAYQESNSSSNLTLWTDSNCEFVVTFPSMPNTTTSNLQAGSDDYLGELKSAEVLFNGALYRSECISVPQEDMNALTSENINARMEQIADRVGLTLRVYEYEQLDGYSVGTITGAKNVDGEESILEIKNFMGKTSVLTLYIVSNPDRFKSADMQWFTESAALKN